MTTHVEPLTEEDKVKNKKVRKTHISNAATITIFLLALSVIIIIDETLEKEKNNLLLLAPFFSLVIIIVQFYLLKRDKKEIEQGTKEVTIGIVKKHKPVFSYQGFEFNIDEKRFSVDQETFKKFEEGTLLRIEKMPKSEYILGIYPQN